MVGSGFAGVTAGMPRGCIDFLIPLWTENIPELTEGRENMTRRFISLVDEFYDRNVKLIVSAEKPIHELYSGRDLVFEFERTISRLVEMQSKDYLSNPRTP